MAHPGWGSPQGPGYPDRLLIGDRFLQSARKRSRTRRRVYVLGDGEMVRAKASASEARFLLVAARPIGEPVARYGPFVMNTREEIERAVKDFRAGRLG